MAAEGDVVLIYYEEQPAVDARGEVIEPDVKKDWYQVSLLLLTLPPQPVTWILRNGYINGDPFSMGGKAVRLEKVKRFTREGNTGTAQETEGQKDDSDKGSKELGKVIPFRKS